MKTEKGKSELLSLRRLTMYSWANHYTNITRAVSPTLRIKKLRLNNLSRNCNQYVNSPI